MTQSLSDSPRTSCVARLPSIETVPIARVSSSLLGRIALIRCRLLVVYRLSPIRRTSIFLNRTRSLWPIPSLSTYPHPLSPQSSPRVPSVFFIPIIAALSTRSPRHRVRISVESPGAMYDLKVKFFQYLAPSGLLPNRFRCASKPLERGMVCSDDELSSQQILPVCAGITDNRK